MKEKMYLKPNVVIEPLFGKWYAWPHLISPATAAMNVTNRHLKIMDSYIKSPKIHSAAVKNPKMLGGPFMDFPEDRVADVRDLKKFTLNDQQDLVNFKRAINDLGDILKKHNSGHSLEDLYDLIPEELRGYVELTYDLNHNISYRLFEPLLYQSKYYKEDSQSVAVWLTENDERPFVLSTPRIKQDGVLELKIPFKSPIIDDLAKMKRIAGDPNKIVDALNLTSQEKDLFMNLFTEKEPVVYEKYEGDKIRMRYFGHACIYIETKEINILVDPLISYYGYDNDISRFSDIDLPEEIDYILITHNHQDHILFETLLPLRHKVKNIIVPKSNVGKLQDPNLKLMLNAIGFDNVIELGEMETLTFDKCNIQGLPFLGEHCDLDIQSKLCYHVAFSEFSVLFMADSCNIESEIYQKVSDMVGEVDVLFLGMECQGAPLSWLYGPLLDTPIEREHDNSRRLSGSNFDKGIKLVDIFKPKEVYVYAMGLEPWLEFISSIKYSKESIPIVESDKLLKTCQQRDLIAERLFGEKELLYSYNNNL